MSFELKEMKVEAGGTDVLSVSDFGVITFNTPKGEIMRFDQDGKVYVRGKLVDENMDVYAAFCSWLISTGQFEKREKVEEDGG